MDSDIETADFSQKRFSENSDEPLLGPETASYIPPSTLGDKLTSFVVSLRVSSLSRVLNMATLLVASTLVVASLFELRNSEQRCAQQLSAWCKVPIDVVNNENR
jgi:hypothetical protein